MISKLAVTLTVSACALMSASVEAEDPPVVVADRYHHP